MAASIKHQLFFQHPPRAVWEYLTNAELMELWLMKSDFQPVIGHEFTFRIGRKSSLDFDGIVYCKVLEIVPFKKLSYSWKAGPGNQKITLDSVVIITLTEKDNGTELTLQHNGFTDVNNSVFAIMDAGWLKNIRKINELN